MITVDKLTALMRSDVAHAVLDLRERGTYERGHVFRATSLPRRQLETRLPGLVTAHATPIALYDVQKPYERGRAAMEAYLRWEEALDLDGQSPHALLPERHGR